MLLIDPMPISVLHVSQSDAGGGSATAAYRIHETLRAPEPPAVSGDCEYCRFAAGAAGA